jgi:hypothetical protein
MDKINYISEQYDEVDTQQSQRVPTVTYDQIMSRLSRHFIRQEVSNNVPRISQPIEQKPISTSAHITAKLNKKVNSERLPGYVQPYRGKPPMGELNTPVNKQRPANTNNHNSIDEKINSLIEQDKRGEMGVPNNINQQEMESKLALMRKIAIHNSKVMSDKNKAAKTQMKFQ